jgi:YHS domain-containing protein
MLRTLFSAGRRLAPVLLVAVVAATSVAAEKVNRNWRGLALEGYDPVAYFTEQKPVKGDPAITTSVDGTTYRFVSAENRDRFVKEPDRYRPQYGGFCAWAVSRGYTANGDPLAWRVVGDKLYLNYNQDVQRMWAEDIPGNISKGDANWPRLKQ